MGKLLILLICALGAVGAGRIPQSENGIPYQLIGGSRGLFELFTPIRELQLRNLEILNRQRGYRDEQQQEQLQDANDRVKYEQELRYNRVPISRNIVELPTVSQDSSRLLHVGRRRQQQIQKRREGQDQETQQTRRQGIYEGIYGQEQEVRRDILGGVDRDDERREYIDRRRQEENVVPRRFGRIGEGRRVGDVDPVTEQDILRFIRLDNRLGELSDEQIVEILRRQRQQQAEQRRVGQQEQGLQQEREQDDLPTMRRDDDRLVYINRRRLDQSRADIIPRRIVSIGEGRRVDEGQLAYNRREQFIEAQRVQEQQRERVQEQQERERVQEEQQRERDRVEQQQRERVRTEQQQRERVRVEQQQRERVREEQQQREGVQERIDDAQRLSDSLPSVRRDDERLVYINRRRLGENAVTRRVGGQQEENVVPRRYGRIGEGRRVGDVDPVTEQDIVQFIRRDNRLGELSDEEIVEMLRRNRERQVQTGGRRVGQQVQEQDEDQDSEKRVQEEGLQTVRRDDERLVHVNRRRLGQGPY